MLDANNDRICSEASTVANNSLTRSIRDRFEALYADRHYVRRSCGMGINCGHRHQSPPYDDAANMEQVLSAFYAAVAQEYGSEEAAKAANDWIEELQKTCAEERVDWRSVTVAAARRLAHRVSSAAQD